MDDIGPAGIRANIEYYQSLIEKNQNQLMELEKELDHWREALSRSTASDSVVVMG